MRKVALVTGGNGEIGSSIAVKLSTSYDIVITYNKSKDKANKVLEQISSGNNTIIKVDLKSVDSIKSMFNKINKKYGRIDLLVNNASFTEECGVEDLSSKTIDRIIDLSIKNVFYCSREFLKFIKEDRKYNIINIGSNSVRTLNASNVIYIACKSATESLTKSFAKEYGKSVRVNCVNPGLIKSNLSSDFFDKRKKYVENNTPMKELCKAIDIADTVYHIVNDMKMMNGQCIDIDGGRTL